ncbi:hypothetical protein A2U01_0020823, partial [Trifolium medium]|nr:hypothetical protein [Trifolium medium]
MLLVLVAAERELTQGDGEAEADCWLFCHCDGNQTSCFKDTIMK